ncbi:MAG: lipoate--protein ligase family protein [Verrucomicrobiales bacterium]|nr:lipoate--protein ligase family protein [Verrucomicrobiales bacterium]
MLLLELPSSDPAGFLAWEDALLDVVEEGGPEMLWFWESPVHFVVVGYSQQVDREVDVAACRELGIPVLRRSSGGGTVLQGPGCLNYGLALRVDSDGPRATIAGTNREILSRIAGALTPLVGGEVQIDGHTDLTVPTPEGPRRKISGNAQRRKRHALLFHGTILHRLDLPLVSRTLKTPSSEPEYRAGRTHGHFVTNTGLDPGAIRSAISAAWQAAPGAPALPEDRQRRALAERYSREDWNFRR